MCDPGASISGGCHLHDHDGQWRTHKCSEPLVLWCDRCLERCPTGTYQFGPACKSCAQNCVECSGPLPEDCEVCSSHFSFDFRGICVSKCSSTGQYGTEIGGCINCHPQCLTCSAGFDLSCTGCATGSNLVQFEYTKSNTQTGYCIPSPDGNMTRFYRELPTDNVVYECPKGCATCRDRYYCLTCLVGYNLYPPSSYGSLWQLCVTY
jgi:hypothetical protein